MSAIKDKFKDETGKTYGRLVVLNKLDLKTKAGALWNCLCSCGNETTVRGSSLRAGTTSSCGCLGKELSSDRKRKHGFYGNPSYRTWANMITRCTDISSKAYKYYGGIGITVCDRWMDVSNFIADMGQRPKGMTLDRINNNLGYSPDNCAWVSMFDQNRNKKSNVNIEIDGVTKSVTDWANDYGLNPKTVFNRIYAGWDVIEAITTKKTGKYL